MTDIEIANSIKPQKIDLIAKKIGLKHKNIEKFGNFKAKINVETIKNKNKNGKLILVTAINPTRAGNGKTTVSIGLADALRLLHKNSCLALREPSLGPVFGIKGGATGGGYSQIVPMEDINLHFNGDFHAITSANNLLCSFIDNHIFQGNELDLDENRIVFNRCLDLNDRALRDITINSNYSRGDKFVITAASEIMAILAVSTNLHDLKMRLGNILVGFTKSDKPVYARDLKVENAMAILLKDAIKPNLVQTLAGTPAIVHCGPFANIAHGCNSIIATKTAMSLSDFCITEAGFGADLGAEKFFDFKCRQFNLKPDCVVLVATIQALKLHGETQNTDLKVEDVEAVKKGLSNLEAHINMLKNVFKVPFVVTINKYISDTENELSVVKNFLSSKGVSYCENEVWAKGGKGAISLAKKVLGKIDFGKNNFEFAYNLEDEIETKIEKLAKKIYGANGIIFSKDAKNDIKMIKKLGFSHFPVIIAKTQYSLSDNQKLLGAPTDFEISVKKLELKTGAGFIVVILNDMLLMPGLSKCPAGSKMTIDDNGNIDGLF